MTFEGLMHSDDNGHDHSWLLLLHSTVQHPKLSSLWYLLQKIANTTTLPVTAVWKQWKSSQGISPFMDGRNYFTELLRQYCLICTYPLRLLKSIWLKWTVLVLMVAKLTWVYHGHVVACTCSCTGVVLLWLQLELPLLRAGFIDAIHGMRN